MPKMKITLEKLDEKLDRKFRRIDKRFDVVDKKLTDHDSRFNIIDKKLVDHDKIFLNYSKAILDLQDDVKEGNENMATKKELNDVNSALDRNYVILKKLDQERIFTIEWIKRIEGEVSRIKNHLGIS